MVGFFLFLILVAYPIFLIVGAIIGGGDNSASHFDNYHRDDSFSNNNSTNSNWERYKYSNLQTGFAKKEAFMNNGKSIGRKKYVFLFCGKEFGKALDSKFYK